MINLPNFAPMTQDDIFAYLNGTGSFQDRERAFLKAEGYETADIAADWMKFLASKGITGGDLATNQKKWFLKEVLANAARKSRGFGIIPQDVPMSITTP